MAHLRFRVPAFYLNGQRTAYDRKVLAVFEPGKRYSEKQVNTILARYSQDTASLRRGLIEYKLMAREAAPGGSVYWRID